ncbi:uncharacterized protein UTRI_10679 [Ustilago trichophora]|uniref:Uncharacterized protein n=1 Tax=Ustilago trichophora TaxID=86804 RepID=A0A5C3E906_9BASI|nr:uncharacterized protein UTRI_10679 [Ustilago trichophora]
MLALRLQNILLSTFLIIVALVALVIAADEPELSAEDEWEFAKALRRFTENRHPSGQDRFRIFGDRELGFYNARHNEYKSQLHDEDPNKHLGLAALLHEDASSGPKILAWSNDAASSSRSSYAGSKPEHAVRGPVYYSTVVTPNSQIGRLGGLAKSGPDHPNGMQAMTFWKYDKVVVRLLGIKTLSYYHEQWHLRRLQDAIPLDSVFLIH